MSNETSISRFEKYNPHMKVVDNDQDGSVSDGDEVVFKENPSEKLSFADDRFSEARGRATAGRYAVGYVYGDSPWQGAGGTVGSAPGLVGIAFQGVMHGLVGNIWDGEARLPLVGWDVMPNFLTNATEWAFGTNTRWGNPDEVNTLNRIANSGTYLVRAAGDHEEAPEGPWAKTKWFFFGPDK